MKPFQTHYDVIVVGGGHAGVEASCMGDRLGCSVGLVTLNPKSIGRMSCNPAIGGLAKGQIVREIDILGGIMGFAADEAGLQFKMLNKSKGKAVWSPRAQVDKRVYENIVLNKIKRSPGINIIEGEVIKLILESNRVVGVKLRGGQTLFSNVVVLTCGTFLNGLVHIGERKIRAGRMGETPAEGITEFLLSEGFSTNRLKTGTPPRLIAQSINWKKLTPSFGDTVPTPFSYRTTVFSPPNIPCYLAQTNPICHETIYRDIELSPMFSGDVKGVGPRYCPSIEDKIYRFSDKASHQLFLEPEWFNSNQIYTNGFSTSLPEKTQLNSLRKVPGLEKVEFFRPGYAIEYDFFPTSQLKASLETKNISNLFFAGQINGTSGYEEAAAQGLIAGINAVRKIQNEKPLLLSRNEAYIGVLIDDLITKESAEPYRMFTSRAEYRILIRYSSAADRLVNKSHQFELISTKHYEKILSYIKVRKQAALALEKPVSPVDINPTLSSLGEAEVKQKMLAKEILKRPGVSIEDLPAWLFDDINTDHVPSFFIDEMMREADITIKYKGYIERQLKEIAYLKENESKIIPLSFNYFSLTNLSKEAREKLSIIRPETLGQASRVSGVTPSDAAVLAVHLHR